MTTRNRLAFPRRAFTLIEMLVAISILTVIATLSIAVIPKIKERTKASAGADNLQQWLLIAKQMALRDRTPTGVRLIVDNDGFVRTLQYIQQPDNFIGPALVFDPADPTHVTLPGVDLSGGLGPNANLWPVQSWVIDPGGLVLKQGDYLQFQNGPYYRIKSVNPTTGSIYTYSQMWLPPPQGTIPPGNTSNFAIIRQPRPIAGEAVLQLPDDIVIDYQLSLPNIPPVGNYDILFSPSGALVGALGNANSAAGGKIVLWVRDVTQDYPLPASAGSQPGDQLLVVVFGRTGRIGGFPWNPDPNVGGGYPYYYVFDPRNSGL